MRQPETAFPVWKRGASAPQASLCPRQLSSAWRGTKFPGPGPMLQRQHTQSGAPLGGALSSMSPSSDFSVGHGFHEFGRTMAGDPLLRVKALGKPVCKRVGGLEDVGKRAHRHVARAGGEKRVDEVEHR